MAVVAHSFTHFDLRCKKGDEIDDDDPLVTLAPHLFVQPEVEPEKRHRNVRIRGELVDQPEPVQEDPPTTPPEAPSKKEASR